MQPNRLTWKKWAATLHLWLGLSSGLVVFIIAITGAIYCFAPEMESLQPYRKVAVEAKPYLPPSRIRAIAEAALPGKTLQRIYYHEPGRSVMALFLKKDQYSYFVFINPYSGQVLKVRDNERDFLSVTLQLHRTLLIPYGHDIIRWSTVIFIFMIISGIVLWWPKNRRRARQGFRIMWKANYKRLSYDLHKVLGFYVAVIALFLALTGLMFAFPGYAGFVYKITGASQSLVQPKPPLSDTTQPRYGTQTPIDRAWQTLAHEWQTKYAAVMFVLPAATNGALLVRANPARHTIYKTDFRYFDQHTGKEIGGAYVWGSYKDATTAADYIRRMNYDWHTGAAFALPGRILLFIAALIVASLPVTGFIFWRGRKRKKRMAK